MPELAAAPGLLAAAAVLVLAGPPRSARALLAAPPRRTAVREPAGVVAAVLAALQLSGPVLAAIGAAAWLVQRRVRTSRQVAAARDDEREGAAEALAVLAAELRAGRPPEVALRAAATVARGPLQAALASAAGSGTVGGDPAGCLLRAREHSAVPAVLQGLGTCWQVCAQSGSSLASAVERLAASQQAEQAQRRAVEAELAGPRATAAMLAALPLAGLALAAGLSARPLDVLLHTPVGIACLVIGLLLEGLGLWWTQRLVIAAGGGT